MEELLKELEKTLQNLGSITEKAKAIVQQEKTTATPENMIHIAHLEELAKNGNWQEAQKYFNNLSKI